MLGVSPLPFLNTRPNMKYETKDGKNSEKAYALYTLAVKIQVFRNMHAPFSSSDEQVTMKHSSIGSNL